MIADPKDLSHITYDQAKHTKVTENFKSLDASKYDKDKVSISQEISDTITLHANSLKPNKLLNSNMVKQCFLLNLWMQIFQLKTRLK